MSALVDSTWWNAWNLIHLNRWIFYFNILTSHIAVDVSIYETFISVFFHIHIQLRFKITVLGFILSWKKIYCQNKQVFGICNVLVYLGKLPKCPFNAYMGTNENHSHKQPAPVTDTFFMSQGCPNTRAFICTTKINLTLVYLSAVS